MMSSDQRAPHMHVVPYSIYGSVGYGVLDCGMLDYGFCIKLAILDHGVLGYGYWIMALNPQESIKTEPNMRLY